MLLQSEINNHQEPVDARGSSSDRAFNETNLIPIPDPVQSEACVQSEPSTTGTQVASPSTAAEEQQPKKEVKSSKLAKALQRKKHSETDI